MKLSIAKKGQVEEIDRKVLQQWNEELWSLRFHFIDTYNLLTTTGRGWDIATFRQILPEGQRQLRALLGRAGILRLTKVREAKRAQKTFEKGIKALMKASERAEKMASRKHLERVSPWIIWEFGGSTAWLDKMENERRSLNSKYDVYR